MKKVMLMLWLAACVQVSQAQKKVTAGSQPVDAAQVPDSVKVAQAHDSATEPEPNGQVRRQ